MNDKIENDENNAEDENAKKRAIERIAKIRNLSFNVNVTDPNNEFETVPAYLRRNMELDPLSPYQELGESSPVEKDYYVLKPEGQSNLSLIFNLSEYDSEEITEIISVLSELYGTLGGDKLTIKSISTSELIPNLIPELV